MELRFDELAESITERVDDPSTAGVDCYVGLEHLEPDTLSIRQWGDPGDVSASKLRFYPGDVIYARRRAYQRKLGVASFAGICSAHALVLRAKPNTCHPDFLPYFLQSDQFHRRALDISVGSLSPTINWRTLSKQRFWVPPIAEQAVVARDLTELEAHLDSLRGAVGASRSLYHALGESVHHLAEESASLGDVLETLIDHRGKTPKKMGTEFVAKGVPVLSAANIKDGRIVVDEPRCVETEVWSRWMSTRTARGDILMTSEAPMGNTAVVPDDQPLVLGQRLFGLRVNARRLSPVLLRAFIDSPRGQALLSRRASGSTVTGIRASALVKIQIPLPPRSEQEDLTARVLETLQVEQRINDAIAAAMPLRGALREQLVGVRDV